MNLTESGMKYNIASSSIVKVKLHLSENDSVPMLFYVW